MSHRLPAGWTIHVHPEGERYFYHHDMRIRRRRVHRLLSVNWVPRFRYGYVSADPRRLLSLTLLLTHQRGCGRLFVSCLDPTTSSRLLSHLPQYVPAISITGEPRVLGSTGFKALTSSFKIKTMQASSCTSGMPSVSLPQSKFSIA